MVALLSRLLPRKPTNAAPDIPGDDTVGKAGWCPRLTRGRLVAGLLMSLIAVFLLLLQCFRPQFITSGGSGICCASSKTRLHPVDDAEGDYDYDEAIEGSLKIRYRHTKRYLPQVLIIGVRKGGTRALLEFLNLHPNIQAAKKEMHFFDTDETYSKGLEWYRKRMPYAFADQITMEKTPAYFTVETVPERVYSMNHSVKMLVVIRDPTERAISDYTQIHSNKLDKGRWHRPFEELVLDENGEVRRSYAAVRRSLYHRHMERWLQFFPNKQFHFISSEKLVANPVHELKMVENFLGLEHKLNDEMFYFNQTKGFYCIRQVASPRQKDKCLAKSKGRTHPLVDPDVLRKVRQFFAPHNEKFFDLIDNHRFDWPTGMDD